VKICLLMLGKTRRAELRAVIDDYVKRIATPAPPSKNSTWTVLQQ
jgi:hypothetical protein